jgi:hypothetical protein
VYFQHSSCGGIGDGAERLLPYREKLTRFSANLAFLSLSGNKPGQADAPGMQRW